MLKPILIGVATIALSACVVVNAGPSNLTSVGTSQTIDTGRFDSIAITGAGEIEIKYGQQHSFKNTGSDDAWEIAVEDDALAVKCRKPCKGWKDRSAVITTPYIEDFALVGGGEVEFSGPFKKTSEFDISLIGGGEIDASDVPADSVNISIVGGGEITVTANQELDVSIVGGGEIKYLGNPEISKSILGGGQIKRVQ